MTQRKHIVVLNGMSGAAVEVRPLAEPLQVYGKVWSPELIGHGGRPIPERFSVAAAATDIIGFMDQNNIPKAVIVGYSMGGLIALYMARHWPDRVTGVCAIAAKYFIDRETSERWLYLGDPDRIAREGNRRAGELERMHQPQDWRRVYAMNRQFYRDLPDAPPLVDADLQAIRVPVKLVSGERDPVVPAEEQAYMATQLKTTPMIWPGAMHPLKFAPLAMLLDIGRWIARLDG